MLSSIHAKKSDLAISTGIAVLYFQYLKNKNGGKVTRSAVNQ